MYTLSHAYNREKVLISTFSTYMNDVLLNYIRSNVHGSRTCQNMYHLVCVVVVVVVVCNSTPTHVHIYDKFMIVFNLCCCQLIQNNYYKMLFIMQKYVARKDLDFILTYFYCRYWSAVRMMSGIRLFGLPKTRHYYMLVG